MMPRPFKIVSTFANHCDKWRSAIQVSELLLMTIELIRDTRFCEISAEKEMTSSSMALAQKLELDEWAMTVLGSSMVITVTCTIFWIVGLSMDWTRAGVDRREPVINEGVVTFWGQQLAVVGNFFIVWLTIIWRIWCRWKACVGSPLQSLEVNIYIETFESIAW